VNDLLLTEKHNLQIEFILKYNKGFLGSVESGFIDKLKKKMESGKDTTWREQKWLNSIYLKIVDRLG
jgi:hypothetical protein